jgi:broad specificity phosphatase PhoE
MAKNNYCTFYIVRHGETDWNVNQICQGQLNSKLNQTGVKQAEQQAKELSQIRFEAAFSSDLWRAKRTAKIIALEHKLAVKTSKLIRERNFGRFQGRPAGDYYRELHDLILKKRQLSFEDRFRHKYEVGIESDEEICTRMITFLREVAVAYSGRTVLVVGHGGPMRTLLIHLGWASYNELPGGSIDNLGYYVLRSDGVEFEVIETVGVHKKEK